ncbi:MAG: response regulator [Lachnospiraceae bacterium]|nr:response regulator [Lachnospiraceae bacterium]
MFTGLVLLQAAAIVVIVLALAYFYRGSSTYAQKLMLSFLIAELVHNAGYLLELFARSEEEAMMAVKIEYLGSSIVAIFFMMFIRNYCGRREHVLAERILLLCGVAVIIMVWSSPAHHLYYKDVEFIYAGAYPHLKLTYGPGFYFYMLACTLIPWGISVWTLFKNVETGNSSKRKGKLLMIILGATFAVVVLILYVLKVFPEGYDPTPVAMAFLFSVLVIFVWNRNDFDLTRTATENVVNSLRDGMITLDEDRKVLMVNDEAKKVFPDIRIGQSVEEVEHFPVHVLEGVKDEQFLIGEKHYEAHMRTVKDFENHVRGYTVLIVDVTGTYEYIKELNIMREKAEEANRAKSNFLANMSHEIRTPMNAVVGMSELIIEECRGRKIFDYACDIKTAALNLLAIINDILDLSKVEAGKMELVESDYYVQCLVEDTTNLIKMAAGQKGLQVNMNLDEKIPHHLRGDEGRIRQVLINIMNNSIKFTKEGYVSLDVTGRYLKRDIFELKMVIEDTGIGIKKEDLATIFDSFKQLDMNRNRKIEGTGLGLSITKQLVSLMQGDIRVESEYGKGTRFIITIPQKVEDGRTVKEVPMKRRDSVESNGPLFICEDFKVLVVDDNLINRKVAEAMLNSYRFQISDACSGREAIDMVEENDYDLIFMDHMMPEMDGMEATKIIRERLADREARPIIVALTANALQGAREGYLTNGFDDFLSKPFDRSQLNALLDQWVPKGRRRVPEKENPKPGAEKEEEGREQKATEPE